MSFTRYESYRVSDAEWLGHIPTHWGDSRVRWLCRRYSGGTPDRDNEAYWQDGTVPWLNSGAVNDRLITRPSEYITEAALDNSSAKWVPAGSLVMALAGQGKTKGMVAQTGFRTTCNQSMAALLPGPRISPRYLFWWLESNYQNIRNMAGGDLRDGLNLELLGDIQVPLPPLDEQSQISALLDRETTKIDALVAEQERLIELLKEKRQASIFHAVTKGLNPDTSMNPSGVEWLGAVPAHWRVQTLKRLLRDAYRYPTYYDISYVDSGVAEVRGEALADGKIERLEDQRFISADTSSQFPRTVLELGDIVMSVRGTIGKVGLVDHSFRGANITANLLRLSPDTSTTNPGYLCWVFRSSAFLSAIDRICPQTTIQTVTVPQLTGIALPLPPLGEQAAIIAHLNSTVSDLDGLRESAVKGIALLQERRSALISAAITGQIDVRGLVPQPV